MTPIIRIRLTVRSQWRIMPLDMHKTNILVRGGLLWLYKRRMTLFITILITSLLASLLLRQLTTLPGGLSASEQAIASTPIGWQGLADNPLFLPIKFLWSVGFFWFGQGGALVSRLPSVLLGAAAILSLALVIRAWHGNRIALFSGILFATSAWTLHVSRYTGFDSSYFVALPLLLLTQIALQRIKQLWLTTLVLLVWSGLLFIPGMIWFVLVAAYWQWGNLQDTWRDYKSWWQRALLPVCGLAWLPLLAYHFFGSTAALLTWAGLPASIGSLADFGLRLGAVPLNLVAQGPNLPEVWLGRLPILDIVSLGFFIAGVWFYSHKWWAARSQLLAIYFVIACLLIALNGPVTLSLVVPLAYLLAAAGIALILNTWLRRFPNNPVARSFAIMLILAGVLTSSAYNLRSYYVVWPSNQITIQRFNSES